MHEQTPRRLYLKGLFSQCAKHHRRRHDLQRCFGPSPTQGAKLRTSCRQTGTRWNRFWTASVELARSSARLKKQSLFINTRAGLQASVYKPFRPRKDKTGQDSTLYDQRHGTPRPSQTPDLPSHHRLGPRHFRDR